MSLSAEEISELMSRVQTLELKAKKLVRESFAGEYQSSFRGSGLDFDDYRAYQPGDEIRFIDWNVTARTNTPHTRTFKEEREMKVYLMVDVSGSTLYGSQTKSKRVLAAEIAATIAFSAIHNNDKVGLILFADKPIKYLPPAKGRSQVLRIIREILVATPGTGHTDMAEVCKFLNRVSDKSALVFCISDFQDMSLERSLTTTAYRHDLIALRLEDPAEADLPKVGKVALRDPETGHQVIVDTKNGTVRSAYRKLRTRFTEGLSDFCKKHSIDYASFSTNEDFFPPLLKLLKSRPSARS